MSGEPFSGLGQYRGVDYSISSSGPVVGPRVYTAELRAAALPYKINVQRFDKRRATWPTYERALKGACLAIDRLYLENKLIPPDEEKTHAEPSHRDDDLSAHEAPTVPDQPAGSEGAPGVVAPARPPVARARKASRTRRPKREGG